MTHLCPSRPTHRQDPLPCPLSILLPSCFAPCLGVCKILIKQFILRPPAWSRLPKQRFTMALNAASHNPSKLIAKSTAIQLANGLQLELLQAPPPDLLRQYPWTLALL